MGTPLALAKAAKYNIARLGYWDAAHFCQEFKRERGHAPHVWLALVRKWEGDPGLFTAVELPKLPPERKPFDETRIPWLGL